MLNEKEKEEYFVQRNLYLCKIWKMENYRQDIAFFSI